MAEMILKATGSKLQIISAIHVTSTQAQYDTCLFEFDEAWDGYGVRTAVFYSNPNNIKAMLLDGGNKCYIPWDSFGNSRYLYIGVYGNNGESYLPTQFVEVMYQPGANVDDHLYPPTPGIYEQFVIGMTNKADKSELNDAINSLDASFAADIDTLTTQLAEKASQTTVNDIAAITSSQYNVLGDGTDETSKIASMMNALPSSGGKIVFDKSKEIVINGTSAINISNKQNVVIEGLRAKGSSAAVFQLVDGSKNITFRDCVFKDFGQVIYLHTCEEVVVDNCTFDGTGYGVIQLAGHASNNVKVINCTAKNMKKDFVEANCTGVARSKNWVISGNHYLGGANYPNSATEERFVGVTAVENIIITNNIVEKVCGDSAIHLEDVGGEILISNNIIDNVVGATNNAYLWIIHNEKTSLIANNIFLRSDTNLTVGKVYGNSNTITAKVKFIGNIIRGTNKNLQGLILANKDNFHVIGNTFENCDIAIELRASNQIIINDNEFINNNYDIFADKGESQYQTEFININNNNFKDTVNYCIKVARNSNGGAITGSKKWVVDNNYFSNNCLGTDTEDFTCIGNTIAEGKTFNLGGTKYTGSVRYAEKNNKIIGSTNWVGVNSGIHKFNGDGATVSIYIPHGLGKTPNNYNVSAASLDAGTAEISFITANTENLIIQFKTAPIVGVDNVSLKWYAEV